MSRNLPAAELSDTPAGVPGTRGEVKMATKVNLVVAAMLLTVWGALTAVETHPFPVAHTDEAPVDLERLAALEDSAARDRNDPASARALADRYLELEQPRLAIVALMAATPDVREDPAILHRLASAYEHTGRMRDALSVAQLALARCGRALGSGGSSTPVPQHDCSEGTYASLDMHQQALAHMVTWGVEDVQNDPRALRAYALATRNARILSAAR